jgi:hypothetical protein
MTKGLTHDRRLLLILGLGLLLVTTLVACGSQDSSMAPPPATIIRAGDSGPTVTLPAGKQAAPATKAAYPAPASGTAQPYPPLSDPTWTPVAYPTK